ncbi:diguanylate cyclase [Candidatus Omnitrophota bacterium]
MENLEFFETQKIKLSSSTAKTAKTTKKRKRKNACLVVIAGGEIGKVFFIDMANMVIGRTENAQIRIDKPYVSRKHARIITKKEGFGIVDLKSTNGTSVNFKPVSHTKQTVLEDGDKVSIGNTSLKFLYKDNLETAFHEELYQLASHDGLTDVYNKATFMKTLEERRHKKPLALILFDIDHFKNINDTYGHLAGDFILRELARVVKTVIRQEELFARFGGEEFIIVIEAQREIAYNVAERIRKLVSEHKFVFRNKKIACAVSLGVYGVTDFAAPINQWIEAADKMLYQAKTTGRNKTCC